LQRGVWFGGRLCLECPESPTGSRSFRPCDASWLALASCREDTSMPAKGHKRVANFGEERGRVESAGGLEAMRVPPVRTDRTSLPYYEPPHPRRETSRSVFESAASPEVVMAAATAAAGGVESLPDASVASFGQTAVLEAVIGNDDRVRVDDARMLSNPWRQI